ncbi:MAG: D-alanyl-D-alanine carboxypeptidase [Ruminococcaceae bacterium]|nr:D-alanyl-D-alanine carboxypeptidase [Oscillospiraceae bacterium]
MKKTLFFAFLLFLLCVTCLAEGIDELEINSKAVYMVNLNNSQVMLSKNAELEMEPASLTKIMTTLIVLENCKDIENERIYISDASLFNEIRREGGSNISLKQGETLTVKDLLYATMLPSACDAAELLAYHFGDGDIDCFVDKMNARAQMIGAADTHFENAHGLSANGHTTTAYDMYLIAAEALKNETFREIISSAAYTIPATEVSAQRNIKYSVELVNKSSSNYYRYASGIKTGFTDQAGRCLITMATKDDASYLIVLMGANLDGVSSPIKTFPDATTLFEYVFNAYSLVHLANSNEVIAHTELVFSEDNRKTLDILAEMDMELLLPHGVSPDMLQRDYKFYDNPELPILKNDKVGTVTYSYDGKEIASFGLLSGTDIYDTLPENGNIVFYPAKGINRISVYKMLLIAGVVLCIIGIVSLLRPKKSKRAVRRLPPARKRNINR